MPKEAIKSCHGGSYTTKVGWSHGDGVQVGVENDETSLLRIFLWEKAESVGAAVRHVVSNHGPQEDELGRQSPWSSDRAVGEALLDLFHNLADFQGVWADLDRRGCNELIKTVRRARNAAFGQDE